MGLAPNRAEGFGYVIKAFLFRAKNRLTFRLHAAFSQEHSHLHRGLAVSFDFRQLNPWKLIE